MSLTIWHNPRCSKSRQALELLNAQGEEVTIYKYLEANPSTQEIQDILRKTGLKARELMRTKEDLYKELGLKEVTQEAALIEAMVAHPKLIERPIVIKGDKALIARPPEKATLL